MGGEEADVKDTQVKQSLWVVSVLLKHRKPCWKKETNIVQIICKPRTFCMQTNTSLLGIRADIKNRTLKMHILRAAVSAARVMGQVHCSRETQTTPRCRWRVGLCVLLYHVKASRYDVAACDNAVENSHQHGTMRALYH